jgi:hypothetical protein
MLPTLVSRYSLQRNSHHADAFEIRLLIAEECRFLRDRDGQPFLRYGERRIWEFADLQSFTPLRFMPPELMGYQGRAVVIDPDIFAVGDIWELLSRDMLGKAVLARTRTGTIASGGAIATSVMLLDCARLTHWRCEENFAECFAFKHDYAAWVSLQLEPRDSVGQLEDQWNDFDCLSPATKMLHNTERRTQPWKTGLPIDFTEGAPTTWLGRLRRRAQKNRRATYQPHPDRKQEQFFFGLLRECLEEGIVSETVIREEVRQNHVRSDIFEVLDRTPLLSGR